MGALSIRPKTSPWILAEMRRVKNSPNIQQKTQKMVPNMSQKKYPKRYGRSSISGVLAILFVHVAKTRSHKR